MSAIALMTVERKSGRAREPPSRTPYSHSIINEPTKLLICKVLATASQSFAVILTVKVLITSIGTGFRAVLRKLTFRDLSTSIDSDDRCQRHRRASVLVGYAPPQEPASITLNHCPATLCRP